MYYSEKEMGERPRNIEEISEIAWRGVQALVDARIEDGSFGATYVSTCYDGAGPIGTDRTAFQHAMRAEIPNLSEYTLLYAEEKPSTVSILDMIEFCWHCIGKPIYSKNDNCLKHIHLRYNIETGREQFREDINRIFRRNGIAYQLTEKGGIERLAPPVLREQLVSAQFLTGDVELDRLLETAHRKFLDPDATTRRESLETLWNGWERLKTLGEGSDKKAQVAALLDDVSGGSSPQFRSALEKEARALTWIGNNLGIRHAETSQEELARSEHVDYCFHRLFSFIQMILRITGEA